MTGVEMRAGVGMLTVVALAGCAPGASAPADPTPVAAVPAAPPAPAGTVRPIEAGEETGTTGPSERPGATADDRVVIGVIGDYGRASPEEGDVAAMVTSWKPDVVITLGDNNYPAGEKTTIDGNIGQYWHHMMKPYKGVFGAGSEDRNRFYPCLGNHDWMQPDAAPYLDYFELPGNERYYDFTVGPVHLYCLDSDPHEPDGVTKDSKQAQWLKDRLATSTEPFKLVYFHHPPYSSGSHGDDPDMQWPFAAWGVSAVLSGHDHTYERLVHDGIPYFVDGLGGASKYPFQNSAEGSQVQYDADFGAMRIEATKTSARFTFYERTGDVIDDVTISAKP